MLRSAGSTVSLRFQEILKHTKEHYHYSLRHRPQERGSYSFSVNLITKNYPAHECNSLISIRRETLQKLLTLLAINSINESNFSDLDVLFSYNFIFYIFFSLYFDNLLYELPSYFPLLNSDIKSLPGNYWSSHC